VLLFVVAVFNLNVVPSIAANGGVTVWLWLISLLLFFWPQGIAVIELAHRYPGEGGVYLVGQRSFRRLPRIPLRLVLLDQQHALRADGDALFRRRVGVCAGSEPSRTGRQQDVRAGAFRLHCWFLLVVLNIVGLGVGKWINNLGGIGTSSPLRCIDRLGHRGLVCALGPPSPAADFRIPANPRFVLNSFGVICFGLVGLELASVMGDEIKDPQRTLARCGLVGRHAIRPAIRGRDAHSAGRR
jgi:amino acid transporter